MKAYNHSLDFTVLALAHAVDGDFHTAGKLLLKASKAHDVKAAVAILEASNAQAFANQQAAAGKRPVKASTKTAAKTRVRAFDMGDEGDIDELIGEGDDEEVEADFDAGDDDEEEDEEEGGDDFEKAFASVLNGMKGRAARK
jgi:hypothetical protein